MFRKPPTFVAFAIWLAFHATFTAVSAGPVPKQLIPGKRITVHVTNVPVAEAVEMIMRQADFKYTLKPRSLFTGSGGKQTVSLNLDRVPFWDAMHALAMQTNVSLWDPTRSALSGVAITNYNNLMVRKTPISVDGVFLTEITGIQYWRNTQFNEAGPTVQGNFTLSLNFAAVPSVSILCIQPNQPHITKAVDNRGNSLVLKGQVFGSQGTSLPFGSQWCESLWVPLERPTHMGSHVKELKGTITALVATRFKVFKYPISSKTPMIFTVSGVSVLMQVVKKEGKKYVVRYSVKAPPMRGTSLRSLRLQTIIDAAENTGNIQLQDSRGNGFVRLSSSQDHQTFITTFDSRQPIFDPNGTPVHAGPPTKIVLTLPLNATRVTIPFDFTNIPLP